MFIYAKDESLTRVERLILTLFDVGAMTQADLQKVLDVNDYTMSRIITSANGSSKKDQKIGSIVENPGVRNSGKIRYLTRPGLEMAASMLGVEPPGKKLVLNEAELRIVAQMGKYAVAYRDEGWNFLTYQGPYKVAQMYKLSVEVRNKTGKNSSKPIVFSMPWPSALVTEASINDVGVSDAFFITYISRAMRPESIAKRIEQWNEVLNRISLFAQLENLDFQHGILFLAPTQDVATKIPDIVRENLSLRNHYDFVSLNNIDDFAIDGSYYPRKITDDL